MPGQVSQVGDLTRHEDSLGWREGAMRVGQARPRVRARARPRVRARARARAPARARARARQAKRAFLARALPAPTKRPLVPSAQRTGVRDQGSQGAVPGASNAGPAKEGLGMVFRRDPDKGPLGSFSGICGYYIRCPF